MNLTARQHAAAAQSLLEAELTRSWIEPISNTYEGADVEDAYRIGMEVRDLKIGVGRSVKGHKVGFTSKAMRSLVGATEPDYGFLYDDWFLPEGSIIDPSSLNRPLAEQEIAFVLGRGLRGPAVNAADVIRATDFVLPALEIVDNRYSGRGQSLIVDSIADAASCGCVVLGGNPMRLVDVDIRRVGGSLSINGELVESGTAAAVMGNPVNAVAWLANKLATFDVGMVPGDVILSGSFIKAARISEGDTILALFDQFGEASISVGRSERR